MKTLKKTLTIIKKLFFAILTLNLFFKIANALDVEPSELIKNLKLLKQHNPPFLIKKVKNGGLCYSKNN